MNDVATYCTCIGWPHISPLAVSFVSMPQPNVSSGGNMALSHTIMGPSCVRGNRPNARSAGNGSYRVDEAAISLPLKLILVNTVPYYTIM